MDFLPINLKVRKKKIVVFGAGKVALHKLKTISRFSANITVVAPEVLPEIKKLKVRVIKEAYHKKFLKGAFLVYACTDSRQINKKIKLEALASGILVNVADDQALCDFISPAVSLHRGLVVSVSSQGKAPSQSVSLRDKIKRYLDED